jgi:hypothetical protein
VHVVDEGGHGVPPLQWQRCARAILTDRQWRFSVKLFTLTRNATAVQNCGGEPCFSAALNELLQILLKTIDFGPASSFAFAGKRKQQLPFQLHRRA